MGYVVLCLLLLGGMVGLQATQPDLFSDGQPLVLVGLLAVGALVGLVRGRRLN